MNDEAAMHGTRTEPNHPGPPRRQGPLGPREGRARRLVAAWGLLGATACGIEGLVVEATDTDHQRPRTTLRGTVEAGVEFPLDRAEFLLHTADGAEVEIFDRVVDGNTFDLALAEAAYPNARLDIRVGGRNLLAVVPMIAEVDGESVFDARRDLEPTEVTVSPESTVAALGFIAKVGSLGRSLQTIDAIAARNTLDTIIQGTATSTFAAIRDAVVTLLERGDVNVETSTSNPVVFQFPEFQPDGPPLTNSLVEGSPALDEPIAIGDFPPFSGRQARFFFDQALRSAVDGIRIQECLDPDRIRVVLEVNFSEGRQSGVCSVINRFKWVRDEPGKRMFFVGGVHESSPVQDTNIDSMMGNQGSWQPNTVPMYDDGTNGDAAPGDNVWTITFDLPRDLRFGYKFTWGKSGDSWTGSEEWPGNQRIMEVVDVNGDGLVYRQDNFADESTNKDFANQRVSVGGSLEWDEDADGDGIADTRERHDLDDDCEPDPLTTPTGVGPATVEPNMDGTCPGEQ